jgi:hypothetical protein
MNPSRHHTSRIPSVLALLALLGGLLLVPHTTHAQPRSGVALSVQASTLGPSVGLHYKATEAVHVRLRGSYLPYSYDDEFEDNDVTANATADLTLGGPEARIEWHPFKTAFNVAGGFLINVTEVDADVIPTKPFEYSDTKTFSPEKLGTLSATVSYPTVAPYFGIGFGDALDNRWSVLVELGAYYTGSPEVEMEGTGLLAPTAGNASILNEGVESFVLLPHVAFGLSYQF